MVSIAELWLPLLIAAVAVFIASSLIHMVFKWHNNEYFKLANEDEVRAAIRKGGAGPGQYVVPHCMDMKEFQSPEMLKKMEEGPVGFITLRPTGAPKMGGNLAQWFGLNLLVACIAAHLAGEALPRGAEIHHVFHMTALITFIAYAGGAISDGIWRGEPWRSVAKNLLDALIYAIVSGFTFAWLWPH